MWDTAAQQVADDFGYSQLGGGEFIHLSGFAVRFVKDILVAGLRALASFAWIETFRLS